MQQQQRLDGQSPSAQSLLPGCIALTVMFIITLYDLIIKYMVARKRPQNGKTLLLAIISSRLASVSTYPRVQNTID